MPTVIRHRVHGPAQWRYQKIYCLAENDSLKNIRWVERFVLGQTDLRKQPDEDQQLLESYQIEEALKIGKLIGLEQGWIIKLDPDNHEQVCKYVGYHIGFETRSDHRQCSKSFFKGEPNKIEKHVVGSTNFVKPKAEYEIQNQINRLNRALIYGRIVAHEKNYTIGRRSGTEKTISNLVYHVGFKHKLS